MKKEDLLKAVGGADDRFIAEAAPKKINFKNRAPRYPMRLMTAAACLCIVAAVFFGYWLISCKRYHSAQWAFPAREPALTRLLCAT